MLDFPQDASLRRTWENRAIVSCGLLALVILCVGCGGTDGSAETEPDGSFAAGKTTVTFVDDSRPTAAHGDVPRQESRTLPTHVYYPAAGEPHAVATEDAPPAATVTGFPLVVFVHGFGGLGSLYQVLATSWAEAGYVVAAADFPLTNLFTKDPTNVDVLNQPADVSFIITEMLRANELPAGPLAGLVDPSRIAVGGHSLGAITALGAGYNDCCYDARISAVVSMAGTLLPFSGPHGMIPAFPGRYFSGPNVPLLLLHGDQDETVPYSLGREVFAAASAPKFLVTILGGDHVRPYVSARADRPEIEASIEATTAFFDHYLKNERGALQRLLAVDQLEVATLEFEARGL